MTLSRRVFLSGVTSIFTPIALWQEISNIPETVESTGLQVQTLLNLDSLSIKEERAILETIQAHPLGWLFRGESDYGLFHLIHEKWNHFSPDFKKNFWVLIVQAALSEEAKLSKPFTENDVKSIYTGYSGGSPDEPAFFMETKNLIKELGKQSFSVRYTYLGPVKLSKKDLDNFKKVGFTLNKSKNILWSQVPLEVIATLWGQVPEPFTHMPKDLYEIDLSQVRKIKLIVLEDEPFGILWLSLMNEVQIQLKFRVLKFFEKGPSLV